MNDDASEPPAKRRRWEALLPREEIAQLLADRQLGELLNRLSDARKRWPRDLELIRSIRVLESHLASHPERRVR